MLLFVDLNGGSWDPDPPDVEDAVHSMLDVVAHKTDEESVADQAATMKTIGVLRQSAGRRPMSKLCTLLSTI